MQYDIHVQSTENHEGDKMLMELRANFTKTDDNSTSHEFGENLMQIEDGSNLTLYELSERFYHDDKKIVVPYETCKNSTCILLCCPPGDRFINDKCRPGNNHIPLPEVYTMNDTTERTGKTLDQVFLLAVYNPCKFDRYLLDPDLSLSDQYMFLDNGSLYRPYATESEMFVKSYCLVILENKNKYDIAVCFKEDLPINLEENAVVYYPVGVLISMPCLLATFVVYSVLPELRNMHGYTLRGYVGSLFVAYTFLAVIQLDRSTAISHTVCITFAFIIHFSFLASFFWLNVMCFDIWWTFGGFRSLQGSIGQRERKKFVMYSIYAWGCASLFTTICAIMDFVPSVPKELIRPEIGLTKCWFNTDEARAIYFYGPMSVTVICNICLFISTALKIVRHKQDTAHHLRSSESRRHDDNKQWFNLYLKLFIVMGINWSMEIISWLFKSAPPYVWYLTDLTNTLQGLIIFIIFVWKEKIKRLLLKRFGCQDRGLFSRNSTRSGCHSSASRTCTTTSGVSMQEKVNPYVQTNCRAKSSSDEAD
ncbi:hypothetical protein PUN28_017664 [Cardiocondyla obscurior]